MDAHFLLTCCASLVKSLGLSEPLMGVRNEMLGLWGTYCKPDLTLYFVVV